MTMPMQAMKSKLKKLMRLMNKLPMTTEARDFAHPGPRCHCRSRRKVREPLRPSWRFRSNWVASLMHPAFAAGF
jgi:hypothetical protein